MCAGSLHHAVLASTPSKAEPLPAEPGATPGERHTFADLGLCPRELAAAASASASVSASASASVETDDGTGECPKGRGVVPLGSDLRVTRYDGVWSAATAGIETVGKEVEAR
jgi:hypothetical protein